MVKKHVKSLPKKPLIKKIIRQKKIFLVKNHVKSLPKKTSNSGQKPLIGTKTLPPIIEHPIFQSLIYIMQSSLPTQTIYVQNLSFFVTVLFDRFTWYWWEIEKKYGTFVDPLEVRLKLFISKIIIYDNQSEVVKKFSKQNLSIVFFSVGQSSKIFWIFT